KKAIFRTQIRETIKAHLNKQEELGNKIKVLTLFFIDKVDNYMKKDGIIRKIFVEEFEKLKDSFDQFKNISSHLIHNGYFAKTRKKGEIIYKDTDGKTKEDKEIYDLIMKDKEKLLSFSEPTSFIFSHSALKEGWDNPNIFQICALREVKREKERRQQIGRGLRLAVDTEGDRIFDNNINVLTVVANESYSEFVGGLQTEYIEAGYKELPKAANAREKVRIKFRKHLASESDDFKTLWDKIRRKTKFNIELDKKKFIENSVSKIKQLDINNLVVNVEKVQVDFDKTGTLKTIYQTTSYGERLVNRINIDNIIERISQETGITRTTTFEILTNIDNLDLLFKNPEEFIRSCISLINISLNELIINEGLKYIPTHDVWEVNLFQDFVSYAKKSIKSKKSVYERVVFDSEGERKFAENLEKNNRVILFTKLPPNFIVDTPLGDYHPDWAIVYKTDIGEKLYLIRETKFVDKLENIRPSEQQKIVCGQKHFKAIDVDFKPVKQLTLEDLV
ncbi:DEAD/DEAH box helicase, partial [Candidatus Roizmanbacteria bacterium]|nr:DEAD/DEAH box helicase [Candidatus Roizmanbacteria bacterium]